MTETTEATATDLRARIVEALNTASGRDEPPSELREWRRHDKHNYNATCAVCRGEVDTLADAVLAVFDDQAAEQVAAEMWLEREDLANDRSRLLTYSTATSDHERLLTIGAGAAFLYGDATPPRDWPGPVFRIDRFASIARRDLGKSWETVSAVARFVDEHGVADAKQLAGLLGEEWGTR